MIKTLSFTAQTPIIQLPSIASGIPSGHGFRLTLWIRRSGTAVRQRIVEIGNDSGRLILGTGDAQGSLVLTVEQGTSRSEVVALAALPLGRWVQVTAAFILGTGILMISGTVVAKATLAALPGGALTRCFVGGGTGGSQFEGSLSQLEISFAPTLGSPKVWASYPLQQAVFDHTEQTDSGPVDYHRVDDTGPDSRHGMVRDALQSAEYASLGPEPVPVLQMDGTGSELRLSPITQLAGELTLEAWVCPSDASKRQVALHLGRAVGAAGTKTSQQLVLCVGGSNKEITLVLVHGWCGFILCTAPNAVESGVFTHIAVSFSQSRVHPLHARTEITLYRQGQAVSVVSIPRPGSLLEELTAIDRERTLDALLRAPTLPRCTISGKVNVRKLTADASIDPFEITSTPTGGALIPRFTGQIAELRIWKTALDPATLDARFLGRIVGNEPSLAANYRLEQAVDGMVHDLSAMRGLGQLPAGSSIVSTTSLPLLPTRGDVHLDVKGKLVTERFRYNQDVYSGLPFTGQVFDATIVARRDSTGTTLGGSTLQITPDGDVSVFLPSENTIQRFEWTAGSTYSIPLPLSGRIRIRFKATDLLCPTLRVRVADMPPGLWTVVRPDREALTKLGSLKGSELLSPPQGKRSPLRTGASEADAQACADVLNQLASVYRPRASSSTTEATTRASLYDLIVDVVEYVTEQGENLVDGMVQLGESAGAYAGALIDNGTAALGSVSSTASSVTSLVVNSLGSNFSDLVSAASRAKARYGKSAIEDCIQSASSLAVVMNGVVGEISHTVVLIGTTIIDGTTYVWRVVCAGVLDAFDAVKSFLKKIAAHITKFIEYLAWLFNWGDFVAASDEIYGDMREILDGVPALVSSLSQYRSQLNEFVTLPSSVGNKSLAELCHVRIPEVPSFDEVEYVTELVNQLFDTSSLPIGGVDSFLDSLSASTSGLDVSALQGLLGSNPSGVADRFTDPVQLVSTPVQELFNNLLTGSSETTVVDFVYDKLIPAAGTALSGLSSALTGHISVPGVTELLEAIMGGRELNLLRAASFIAAIVKVLGEKISSSVSSRSTVQPVSYGPSPGETRKDAASAAFAFGILFSLLEGVRAYLEAKSTPSSSKIPRIKLDMVLGVILMGRAGCAYGMLKGRTVPVQKALAAQASVELLAGLGELVMSGIRLLTTNGELTHLAYQIGLTCLSAGFAGWAADVGVCTTNAEWAVFGLSVGGVVFAQISTVIGLALDHKGGAAGSVIPAVQIGFGVVATVSDVAALLIEITS